MSKLPLEKHLESKCCAYAEAQGFGNIKLDLAKRSWFDRMFYGQNATVWFVEFKRPGQKLRPNQVKRRDELRALGFDVSVVDDIDDFKTLIEDRKQ